MPRHRGPATSVGEFDQHESKKVEFTVAAILLSLDAWVVFNISTGSLEAIDLGVSVPDFRGVAGFARLVATGDGYRCRHSCVAELYGLVDGKRRWAAIGLSNEIRSSHYKDGG